MIYLSNAFSLQMQGDLNCNTMPVSVDTVKGVLTPYHQGDDEAKEKYHGTGPLKFPAVSIVGHADIMTIINNQLGLSGESCYQVNRETITLNHGDRLYVAQYIGTRLPEGATALPEGATIRWYCVECTKYNPDTIRERWTALREAAYRYASENDVSYLEKAIKEVFPQYFQEHTFD